MGNTIAAVFRAYRLSLSKDFSFVCLRADGAYEAPSTVGIMCRAAKKKVKGLEDFHFHTLRHTYTSNLLSGGAKPKDVQELLGHSDVSTTMNIYAHSTREGKRSVLPQGCWIRWSVGNKKLPLFRLVRTKTRANR